MGQVLWWIRAACLLAVLAALGLAAAPGSAVSVGDRIEVHGFVEAQIRAIQRDFGGDDLDLTQWYNILNLEIEADVAPNGVGPFNLITMFARIEARFDCVWYQACHLFPSADAYRIRHQRKIPERLIDAKRTGFSSNNYIGDERAFYDVPYGSAGRATPDDRRLRPDGSRNTMRLWQTNNFTSLFGSTSYGADGEPAVFGEALEPAGGVAHLTNNPPYDDPVWFIFRDLLVDGCRDEWGGRDRPGPEDGRSAGETFLLNPECEYDNLAAAADFPNPFRSGDYNPLIDSDGSAALPYRPATNAGYRSNANLDTPRGLYYPNQRLQEMIRDGDVGLIDTTFSRTELAWNRGASQQDQKELKELYFDFELFDSRLWVRAGYQTIVWGKTELFRNQDQFNPQDLALASLPNLEESRISLWAIRGVYSLYDVGPLQDVRLELAANIDSYETNDFGNCGEPYTILAVCGFATGFIASGYLGLGLAGVVDPPSPWQDWSGIEVGGRVEWRYDRFSFAITDFYGYQDIPWVSREFTYRRNVDPLTGRPRHTEATGNCKTGRNSSCLRGGDHALNFHHANQQLFATICADTLAVAPTLDPTACLANVFGSPAETELDGQTGPPIVVALGTALSGDTPSDVGLIFPGVAGLNDNTTAAIRSYTYDGRGKVTVNLNKDPNDGPIDIPPGHPLTLRDDFSTTVLFLETLDGSLSNKLTDWQEALLGCGKFYDTSCDLDGMDLLNAEAGALFQSFPNIQGTSNFPDSRWDTTDASVTQPGTVGFFGEPPCTRNENGKLFVLPGCRGPGDSGYDPSKDGTVTGLLQPFTGQQFQNEMAVVSWNFLMLLTGFGVDPDRPEIRPQDFNPDDPFRVGGCSFRQPQWCSNVGDILALSGSQRNDIKAGGNGTFGRRDFVWHSGGFVVARAQKTNVLGFSMDFAEDFTKSNWGAEYTWVNDIFFGNNDAFDGISEVDLHRLTISVDRPTFVNFLNANRTFFVNTQWFFQYIDGYESGFTSDGALSIFGVLAISTGYFQDRLLPSLTMVYFVMNNSFAILPQVTYRFNESFSATVGVAGFGGRFQEERVPINPVGPANLRFGRSANSTFVENGIAVIRERDEIFLRIRYTF
jgi:hypothetical protein